MLSLFLCTVYTLKYEPDVDGLTFLVQSEKILHHLLKRQISLDHLQALHSEIYVTFMECRTGQKFNVEN